MCLMTNKDILAPPPWSKKLKTLLKILQDGNCHSGTVLGEKLQLTRSAIWKNIKQLKNYGINIEAKTNLGYWIPQGLELLDKKAIVKNLRNRHLIDPKKLYVFDELSSTNDYLSELIKTKKAEEHKECICFSEYQSKGKGRLGRKWVSPFAQNIYLSIFWQFSCKPHELSSLSLVIAIAVTEALKDYGIKKDLDLKWPNDILWQKRKLAGILIELSGEAHHAYNAIISIGLNVNMSQNAGKEIDQAWCDISQITNEIPKRNELAGLLLDHVFNAITTYQGQGLKPFMKKWLQLDVTYGKKVTLITPTEKITGTGAGIDKNGYFLLKDRQGKITSFASGEISLRF